MEMRSLDLLGDGTDAAAPACNMQGAGVVFPTFEDDEDEGQGDDDEDEEFQDIRLPDLLRYSFDYLKEDDPVYIETENAFYILQGRSRRWYFREFYKPLRILQAVLSTAFQTPEQEYHDFLKHFLTLTTLDQALSEGDLWSVVLKLNPITECLPYSGKLRNAKFVRHLLKHEPPPISRQRLRPPTAYHGENKSKSRPNQTRVTPHIAKLAAGLSKEELGVIGQPRKKKHCLHMRHF
ncbi:hypothetical protein BJ138DRAFT_1118997 [Hygrophoropsis aurantiaca]|uniref:Uncharacterized protein n=1 Tax=Hygrophoropsis aurantiaca TaxID=72124 RepID=A0ACB7ZV98_9AGAM|nr:hypothetical protein BJ138DRAFT_1118997 [Hygrophoropsis aurantiaca]